MAVVAISERPLDPAALVEAVSPSAGTGAGAAGAIVTFLGVVRGENLGRKVFALEYEAYRPLAVKALERVRDEAAAEWPGVRLAVHHRVGRLALGEVSVAIAAASAHRAEAFAACRYAIERVKQIAPIWKREHFEGGEVWIEGATADPDDETAREEALTRACR
jgi:molybdopterin synthase catalytic subunit